MPEYRIGIGLNLTLGDLEPFVVDPQSPDGVTAAERTNGVDGSVYEAGLHIWLRWPVIDGEEDYQAILAQLDLEDFLRRPVTIYAPNRARRWHVYSGYAIAPPSPNYQLWPQDVRVLINRLYLVAE